jgi:hypothetical protein
LIFFVIAFTDRGLCYKKTLVLVFALVIQKIDIYGRLGEGRPKSVQFFQIFLSLLGVPVLNQWGHEAGELPDLFLHLPETAKDPGLGHGVMNLQQADHQDDDQQEPYLVCRGIPGPNLHEIVDDQGHEKKKHHQKLGGKIEEPGLAGRGFEIATHHGLGVGDVG